MHSIYHTDGIVLGSRNIGESGKRVDLLTRELGFVSATALNARAISSKLRYGLQDFTLGRFAFVQGKNGWRLTAAIPDKNFFTVLFGGRRRQILGNVGLLLRRLLHGEEKNDSLFDLVISGLNFLEAMGKDGRYGGESDDLEIVLVLRILRNLGYIGESPTLSRFTSIVDWNSEILAFMRNCRPEALAAINKSLHESHL